MKTDIKEAFYNHVIGLPDVTAIIGDRLYPGIAPQNADAPYAVYDRLGFSEEAHLSGQSGMAQATIQVACWGPSAKDVENAFIVLQDRLDGYQGLMYGVDVRSTRIINVVDGLLSPSDGSPVARHRVTLTIDLWYKDA